MTIRFAFSSRLLLSHDTALFPPREPSYGAALRPNATATAFKMQLSGHVMHPRGMIMCVHQLSKSASVARISMAKSILL